MRDQIVSRAGRPYEKCSRNLDNEIPLNLLCSREESVEAREYEILYARKRAPNA